MSNLQKAGGLAALYMATAYVVGIVMFLLVLDYPNIVDPSQKVALVVNKQALIYATNLMLYVVFGIFLIVLALALYERLRTAPAIMQVATAVGVIWAGSLVASGMISNAGIAPVVALYTTDPAQAALAWLSIEAVASGLGNGNGEILGGLFTLLVSWAALRTGEFPKYLGYLGLIVGVVGIASTVPGLSDLVAIFGVSQVVWFVWIAVVMQQPSPSRA
jgi:hypothetical protein